MASKLPYNSLPNLGDLQAGDIVPMLRPPFQEGSAFVSDVQKYVRPYAVYTALLSQSGTSAPTAIVLENTIGEIVWNYDAIGAYSATLNGSNFDANKTVFFIAPPTWDGGDVYYKAGFDGNTPFYLLVTYIPTGLQVNNVLLNTPIEIRVYYSEPA